MEHGTFTADELRSKANELRTQLIATMDEFIVRNPTVPARIVMAGLGELLIQYSVGQVGPKTTNQFLDDLKAAVQRFTPSQH